MKTVAIMKIIVRNTAGIPNKYVRLLKWKLFRLKRKFRDIEYVRVYVSKEGHTHKAYQAVLQLAIPGKDIIIRKRGRTPSMLIAASHKGAKRYLSQRANNYRH